MWTKPEAIEIKMDAEIGSYQSDDRDDDFPLVARPGLGESALDGAADR